jgi:hypothetical protein
MKLIRNTGSDRVIDELRQSLLPQSPLDMASPAFSLFAFAELRQLLENLDACRMVLPAANENDLGLTGTDADRAFRMRIMTSTNACTKTLVRIHPKNPKESDDFLASLSLLVLKRCSVKPNSIQVASGR